MALGASSQVEATGAVTLAPWCDLSPQVATWWATCSASLNGLQKDPKLIRNNTGEGAGFRLTQKKIVHQGINVVRLSSLVVYKASLFFSCPQPLRLLQHPGHPLVPSIQTIISAPPGRSAGAGALHDIPVPALIPSLFFKPYSDTVTASAEFSLPNATWVVFRRIRAGCVTLGIWWCKV